MVCKNCSNVFSNNDCVCPKCGTKYEKDQVNTSPDETVSESVPMQGNNNTVQSNPAAAEINKEPVSGTVPSTNASSNIKSDDVVPPVPVKKDKKGKAPKKKLKMFIAVFGGIAVAACLVFFIVVPFIKNLIINSMSPNDYLKYILTEKNSVSASAGDAVKNLKTTLSGDVGFNTTAKVELHDGVYDLIGVTADIKPGEVRDELSWLKKSQIELQTASKDDLAGLNAKASVNGTQVISAKAALNTGNLTGYLTVPELSKESIRFNLDDGSSSSSLFLIIFAHMDDIVNALPEPKLVESLVDRYLDIVFDELSEVTKDKDTLTVGKISQKCNLVTVNVPYEDFYNITKKILITAKNDEELTELLTPLLPVIAEITDEYLAACGYSETERAFIKQMISVEMVEPVIGMLLDELETSHKNGSLRYDDEIVIKIWTNNKHEIIGTSLTVNDRENFAVRSATKGSKFEDEIVISSYGQPITVLSGNGKISFGKKSGDYDIGINSEYVKATLKDFNLGNWHNKGQIDGSIKLEIGSDFPSGVLESNFGSENADIIRDSAVTFKLSHSGLTTSQIDAEVEYNNKKAFTVSLISKVKNSKDVSVPKSSYNVEKSAEANKYAASISFDKLIKNLDKAGLPDDMLDELKDSFDEVEEMIR